MLSWSGWIAALLEALAFIEYRCCGFGWCEIQEVADTIRSLLEYLEVNWTKYKEEQMKRWASYWDHLAVRTELYTCETDWPRAPDKILSLWGRILKTRLKKGRGGNFSQSRERGARQEYYWALEIDVMRGFWVAYAINPGKNERENYRLDMKWFHGDFSSFDKLNSMNFIEHIHREILHDEIQFWAIEFCL